MRLLAALLLTGFATVGIATWVAYKALESYFTGDGQWPF